MITYIGKLVLQVEVVPLKKQAQEQFVAVYGNLTKLLGSSATADLLSKSLFIISVGGNDLFEYKYLNSTQEGLDQFIQHLMAEYEANLRVINYQADISLEQRILWLTMN